MSATRTPRRVRSTGTRTHSDRWGNVSRFVVVECVRLASEGRWSGRHYEWRTARAVEVAS